MRKINYVLVLLAVVWVGCQKKEIDCEKFCAIPEKHQLFKSFEIEKQFKYFNACSCQGDSILEKYLFAQEISEREELLDFLLNNLRNESDEKILVDSIDLLHYVCTTKDVDKRKDISDLVNQTINKISEKDERDLVGRIFGSKIESRKERLEKLAYEIEERTK